MRLVLEIEETDDLQRLDQIITSLKPYLPNSSPTVRYSGKLREIQAFLDFTERESIHVEKLNIPHREVRNAR